MTKILLVEDNQTNCLLLSDYLEYCGYEVEAITSGEGFFSAIESFRPNLILLDLKMPRIDGYTLLQEMRCHPRWQHIPVIVISALSFRTHQARALELGANRYLVKPIMPERLKHVIQEELKEQNGPSMQEDFPTKDGHYFSRYPSALPFPLDNHVLMGNSHVC